VFEVGRILGIVVKGEGVRGETRAGWQQADDNECGKSGEESGEESGEGTGCRK
jgi:hypothetical protein